MAKTEKFANDWMEDNTANSTGNWDFDVVHMDRNVIDVLSHIETFVGDVAEKMFGDRNAFLQRREKRPLCLAAIFRQIPIGALCSASCIAVIPVFVFFDQEEWKLINMVKNLHRKPAKSTGSD
jgi:hypothetical protein